jgi:hypothetical protein
VQLQLLQLGFWSLVMVWNFCLGYGLDSLLGALALERRMLPWLAIGSKGLLLELFYLSRLRCSGVALCLWLGDNIAILSMEK